MQYQPQTTAGRPQLSLFEGLIAHRIPFDEVTKTAPALSNECLSEMSFNGSNGHCRLLLAPILRDLSDATDTRWLTLIAPPASLSQSWLRETGLNRDRILLLQADSPQASVELACKALMSGCSHTVITWLGQLTGGNRNKLNAAARLGNAQSLNIKMGH